MKSFDGSENKLVILKMVAFLNKLENDKQIDIHQNVVV
jgi:hypothetical protein